MTFQSCLRINSYTGKIGFIDMQRTDDFDEYLIADLVYNERTTCLRIEICISKTVVLEKNNAIIDVEACVYIRMWNYRQ